MITELTREQILAADEDFLLGLKFALEGGTTTAVALFSYETPRQLRRLQHRVAELLPEYQHLHIDFTGQRVFNLHTSLREQPAVKSAWEEYEAENQGEAEPHTLHVVHISGLEGTLLVELTTKENEFLPSLNMERESFFRDVPFIKILWVTTWEMDKIRHETADFYSWLTLKHHFEALSEEIDPLPVTPPDPPPVPFYTPERQKYVEDLEARLQTLGIGQDPDTQRTAANLSKLLAREYDEANDFEKSERAWKKALAHLQRYQSSDLERGEVRSSIGEALTELRKFREAEVFLLEAKDVFEKGGSRRNGMKNDMLLALLFYHERKWEQVLEVLGKWEEDATRYDLEDELGVVFHLKGMTYDIMRQFPQALENYQKALERDEKIGQQHRLGSHFHQIGIAYAAMHQFPQALKNYQQALEWIEKTGRQHELGGTYHQIGYAYADMRQFPQALKNYQQALEWEEKTGQQHELGGTFHQLGVAYAEMRQYPLALEHYQKALEWNEKTGRQHELGGTFHQLGVAYAEMRQYPQALEHYQKALEWNEKTGQKHELGATYFNIGTVYETMEYFEDAEHCYEKAIENLEQHNDPNLSIALASLNRVRHAIALTHQAPPPEPELSHSDQKSLAHQYLSSAQYEKALPLYEATLKTLEALPAAQIEENRPEIARTQLGLGICYLHRAGKLTRSIPEKENLEAAYALAKTLVEEKNELSLPLYLEAGYWLLLSMKKELGGWFPSKSKKAAWETLRAELLSAAGPETEWAEKLKQLSIKG